MKAFAILSAILTTAFPSPAGPLTLEDISPHLSTNAQIIWKAPTNHLPGNFRIYKRLPQTFSAATISNALVLASFQNKGPVLPSTNEIYILDRNRKGDDPLAGHFTIIPRFASISYQIRNHALGSAVDIPSDKAIAERAWDCAMRLGLDRVQLLQKSTSNRMCEYDEKGRLGTNDSIGGREIVLARLIDGITFYGNGNEEGFCIEFGSHGKIRSFSLVWPNLELGEISQAARPEQIIRCIRAYKTPLIPNDDEGGPYFARIKSLANAKAFTITKIIPYYGEGVFGEVPTNNEPPELVAPFAELEAVADFGNSNLTVRLFSPMLLSDATRLLTVKIK
jgi:hypothetical protein